MCQGSEKGTRSDNIRKLSFLQKQKTFDRRLDGRGQAKCFGSMEEGFFSRLVSIISGYGVFGQKSSNTKKNKSII